MHPITNCDTNNPRSNRCTATSGWKVRVLDVNHQVNELQGQTEPVPRYASVQSQDAMEK